MAGKYRAFLIGNSTYPADDHNLPPLKGPVKDIAAVNRALTDPASGLFDDLDVALIAETTSSRALRALGRFFGCADRDDVLLVYFSGHGKLDQGGRLHLCMQDTETTDLLSTALSSTRINEFAEASRARNVAIVLDCCYAGAFRGGDFGEAVAGPGRYVLTSCRGTQLANDATVENGTSYFTQHLVDGMLGAAADRDEDGYVDFPISIPTSTGNCAPKGNRYRSAAWSATGISAWPGAPYPRPTFDRRRRPTTINARKNHLQRCPCPVRARDQQGQVADAPSSSPPASSSSRARSSPSLPQTREVTAAERRRRRTRPTPPAPTLRPGRGG